MNLYTKKSYLQKIVTLIQKGTKEQLKSEIKRNKENWGEIFNLLEEEEYKQKLIDTIRDIANLSEIEDFINSTYGVLSQKNIDTLSSSAIDSKEINFLVRFILGYFEHNYDASNLIEAFESLVDEMISQKKEQEILIFASSHLWAICKYENLRITNSINKIITFIVSTGNPNYIYALTHSTKHTHYFRNMVQFLIATNDLYYIYKIAILTDISSEVISDLVNAAIDTNIPAYMYLFAAKVKNIPEQIMKLLIVAMFKTKDEKYIKYLITELKKKELSQDIQDFIKQNFPFHINESYVYDEKLSDEIEDALENDDIEQLGKFGIVLSKGNSFDTKK